MQVFEKEYHVLPDKAGKNGLTSSLTYGTFLKKGVVKCKDLVEDQFTGRLDAL